VTNFVQAKTRRTLAFAAPNESAAVAHKDQDGIFPFLAEDWEQP
jgi:hypothetical protein